jgi:hypothetical protein
MTERLCKNCEFWDKADWSLSSGKGDCRRYAPQAFLGGYEAILILAMRNLGKSILGDEEGIDATGARWPWTAEWESCGEFSHKNPAIFPATESVKKQEKYNQDNDLDQEIIPPNNPQKSSPSNTGDRE